MAYKRFQNTVTESKLMLPLSAIVVGASCYMAGLVSEGLWIQAVCLLVSSILFLELNNINQLLRVVSQSTPSLFLLLVSSSIFIFPQLETGIIQLCMIALYFMLFHCSQHHESPGWVFYGFFCLGLASMVFVQVMYFVPLLWILMGTCLRALNSKTFFASLMGIITPYWIASPLILYFFGIEKVLGHFHALGEFHQLGDYSMIGEHEWVGIGWTAFLALVGIIHYARRGYQDKIRTRLLHEIFIVMDLATILFLALQPQHYIILLSIMIVNTSPLIAHYLTLTHTWLTNISFHIIILITLLIIAYHIWIPSSSFLSAMVMQACSYLPL